MPDAKLSIELSRDEAVVLFEFPSRFDAGGGLRVEDRAEESVLWRVLAALEKSLVEPFIAGVPQTPARSPRARA